VGLLRSAERRPGLRLPLLLAVAVAWAGCDSPSAPGVDPDREDPDPPSPPEVVDQRRQVGSFLCLGSRAALTLECRPDGEGGAEPVPGLPRILGGQGYLVRLTSSNVAYDGGAGQFTFDVTVENLTQHIVGATDLGSDTDLRVFFTAGPFVTSGSGSAGVLPDGVGTFTAAAQPFYAYPEAGLGPGGVTPSRTWTLTMPSSVLEFEFSVRVMADVIPSLLISRASTSGGNRVLTWLVGITPALSAGDLVAPASGEAITPTSARGKIYYARTAVAEQGIWWYTQAEGSTRLTTGPDRDPSRDPTGNRLAFLRDVSGQGRLFVADSLGGGATELLPGAGGGVTFGRPLYSVRGELLFTGTQTGNRNGIYRVAAEGGEPELLLLSPASGDPVVDPAWTPDGTGLLYVQGSGLYHYLTDTGVAEEVASAPAGWLFQKPTPLQDGRVVYLRYQSVSPFQQRMFRVTPPAWEVEEELFDAGNLLTTPVAGFTEFVY